MASEATERLSHGLQALSAIERYTTGPSLREGLGDDLTGSAILRPLGIVREALPAEPSLQQIWPAITGAVSFGLIALSKNLSQQDSLIFDSSRQIFTASCVDAGASCRRPNSHKNLPSLLRVLARLPREGELARV